MLRAITDSRKKSDTTNFFINPSWVEVWRNFTIHNGITVNRLFCWLTWGDNLKLGEMTNGYAENKKKPLSG
jgi:hypothetical protein